MPSYERDWFLLQMRLHDLISDSACHSVFNHLYCFNLLHYFGLLFYSVLILEFFFLLAYDFAGEEESFHGFH